ncbi:DNA polymerase III, epsilon subunit [Teredinibacter turnerae T7901]|uniref:DNA polymerase III subunit epsilon n=1 Tax=Teredinibacter turnerae (strain ATCC 39867 / T7901) TaxID=377629 RepID=C5BJA7_TERTT|nr:DNA polymerase III subunit epsilon [Teredinibacter turnerae]ACR12681.1 DNA polymerase III, epsilon subunit [Teredinibacter turnerae T7901]
MRQIVLDTETTGLEPEQGHRIIEIGCVELFNRKLTGKHFHQYIRPDREIDEGAIEVHGITNEFLADKPVFAQIADDFLTFIGDAELVIHNAPFDVGFLDHELRLLNRGLAPIRERCGVLDTLVYARRKHPGQKNNLDALCKRYMVDNSQRDLHGALLDAEILADVYLAMTGGQTALALGGQQGDGSGGDGEEQIIRLSADRPRLKVLRANDEEIEAHKAKLATLDKASGGNCLWLQQEQ